MGLELGSRKMGTQLLGILRDNLEDLVSGDPRRAQPALRRAEGLGKSHSGL